MRRKTQNVLWSFAWVWFIVLFCNVVQAAAPDWQVITYPNYTGVMARVKINGVTVNSAGSLLAAFQGDECRGVAEISGLNLGENIDGECYFNLMYGSESTNEGGFTFKLWNSADDKVYNVPGTLGFNTNYPAQPDEFGGFVNGAFVPVVMNIQGTASKHSISISGGTADKIEAAPGELVTITATLPSGKGLQIWSANGNVQFVGSVLGATTTFIMPSENVTITASFITKSQMPAVSVKSTASAADATAKEPSSANGSADKGKFTFTRTLPSGMTGALTVYYSVRGTATNGVDYKSLPGSITFPANADTVTCNVEPLFDGVDEDDETVEVVLEPANGAQTYRGGTYTDAAITIEDTEATVGPTPDTKYTLTVVNGTINGTTATTAQITAGEEVTITTKTLASGRAFGIWTASEDVEFTGSVMGSTTTFLMPAKNVTVTGSDVLKSSLQAVAVRSTTNQGDDTAKEPSSATVSASDKGKFTFTRTSSSGALTVYYAIRGTATNGVDYKSISGSIAFASGKTSVELPIEPLFDGVNEGDETVTVALAPAGANLTYRGGAVTSATVVIEDSDEPTPVVKYTVTVVDGTINELTTVTSTAEFAAGEQVAIKANEAPAGKVFDRWTSDSNVVFANEAASETTFEMPSRNVTVTATYKDEEQPTPGGKYTLTVVNGTINGTTATTAQISAGEEVTITTKTLASGRAFGVWTASEAVEFTGSVMGSTTTFIMPAKNVTITGSDVLKSSLQAVAVRSTTNQGDDTAQEPSSATVSASDKGKFTFTRTSSSGALTVYYVIRGTATNGVDYKSISGSIAFASGKTSVELPIEPLYDELLEGDETVTVALAPAGANLTYRGGAVTSATVVIGDYVPDTRRTLTVSGGKINLDGVMVSSAKFNPGDEVIITATLPSGQGLKIWTANKNVEFIGSKLAATTTVVMPSEDVTVTANFIKKSDMQAVSVRSTTNQGDDTAKEPETANGAADTGKFTFTRTSSSGALTVYYSVRGTATNGVDYTSIPGSISFANGATSVDCEIVPLYDTLTEGNETVTVVLEPATPTQTYRGGTYTDATITIEDSVHEDPTPGDDPYHPADCITQDYIISGTEYLNYIGPVKAAALGNYEVEWDGVDVLSLARKSTRGGDDAQTRGDGIAITREVSPAVYTAGSTVAVTLTISGADKMANLFIGEIIPAGWTVVGNAANNVIDGVLRMAWESPDVPGTFTYSIKAPSANLADSYVIASSAGDTACFTDELTLIAVADTALLNSSNNYQYHPADCINKDKRISGVEYLTYAGPVKAAALGNYVYTWDGVDVLSLRRKDGTRGGAADDVAIARSVDTTTYEANDQIIVTLTITGADDMVSLFVGEKIPEGWTVVGDDAANVKNGVLRMTWDAPNIPETVTYTLQAPAGDLAAIYQIATSSVDTGCFTDRVLFLKAEDTILTWDTDQKPAEWPQDMKLYTPAVGKNYREADKLVVTFSWPAILNADGYRLVVATYDGAVVFDETLNETICAVSGLECGSFVWNVTAIGDACVAGTSDSFFFAVVPDSPAPIAIAAAADGTVVCLAFDTADAAYTDGVFAYQMAFFSLKTCSWISLTQDLQIANGRAIIDLGVDASNGYLYISPVTTPESDFIELFIK